MDRANDIIRRSLEEGEKMATKLKADRNSMDCKIQYERLQADLSKREERRQYDEHILLQRAELDKVIQNKNSEIAKTVRIDQIALLNKALDDQHAIYAQKIQEERTLSNEALQKAREENDAILKSERQNSESMIKQARAQLAELDNERKRLKTLIESMIQQEDGHDNMNVEVQDVIYIPRTCLSILMNNNCGSHVVMRFKVHSVEKIYSDLQLYYDSREELGEFAIVKPATTVEYFLMVETLSTDFGYIGDAVLYYLNPAHGSQLPTALVKIDGQEDVDQLVDVHDHERTRICHLYVVNGAGFNNHGSESGMKLKLWEHDETAAEPYDEAAEQDDMSPANKKRAVE